MRMKALVKYAEGPGNMEIREMDIPSPGPGQVLLQVMEAGICGSDLHIYHSDIAIPVRPPVVTGHEFSGVVVGLGEGVTDYAPGDRVVSETAFSYCGNCAHCAEGFYNLCNERKTLGYWYNGVFTNYTIVPAERLHRIPDGVSFTAAAMTEPLACVVHGIYDCCRIRAGDLVLVSGPGSIGLMALQVAKAQGAKVLVSGTDVDAERLALARQLGADAVINIQQESLEERVDGWTDGAGVDVVLECSGAPQAICAAFPLMRKRGYYLQIGLPGKAFMFDFESTCYKELHVSGTLGSRKDSWRRALKLMESGQIQLEPLVSHKFSVLDWEKAFAHFESKQGCKLFLLPEPLEGQA